MDWQGNCLPSAVSCAMVDKILPVGRRVQWGRELDAAAQTVPSSRIALLPLVLKNEFEALNLFGTHSV